MASKPFNFEKNLPHQTDAVNSVISVFNGLSTDNSTFIDAQTANPIYKLDLQYLKNISLVQSNNSIKATAPTKSNIIDVMMETGTGKTYTYTKTIFELNKQLGIFKFVVVVPTLSIKAGTVNFLKSDSSRQHFIEQYSKVLNLHIVASQTKGKSGRSEIPSAISSFVNASRTDTNAIEVLIINSGMINSDTLQKTYDRSLLDKFSVPYQALAATNPFVIIDEPHKFAQDSKTWDNMLKMKPNFIIRYGATFPEATTDKKSKPPKQFPQFHNLVYTLSAVDSFNQNLIKGVIGHIVGAGTHHPNAQVKFIDSDGSEARFELNENNQKKSFGVTKQESLEKIHKEMSGLVIEKLNKSTVELSNGLTLKKGDIINPYSYAQTLQELMIRRSVANHFIKEKELLNREVRIKPLTLFFIDNIDEYRGKEGYIRKLLEESVKAEIEALLTTEPQGYYREYLEQSLTDLSLVHGGYFSKDNSDSDEAIEKEINEILHDKQAILDLSNPRRFIFSKWTLREGWDNPNVFQICKLRSSGSETSKLQEVGRGLRLPVNEFGNRVKDEQFYLDYYVDFTEQDFISRLVDEINTKSGAVSIDDIPTVLNDNIISLILEHYPDVYLDKKQLLKDLMMKKEIIEVDYTFINKGFDYIKSNFPNIFNGVNSNKVRVATATKKTITVRTAKYSELKQLWEKINERVVLEYKFNTEPDFLKFFTQFISDSKGKFGTAEIGIESHRLATVDNKATEVNEPQSVYNSKVQAINTLTYTSFVSDIAKALNVKTDTIHRAITDSKVELNSIAHRATVRTIKQEFNNYLMAKATDKFSIEYKKVTNQLSVHPTKLTNANGEVLPHISATDIGILYSDSKVANNYLFEQLYYDSELEKTNISTDIKAVIIFTKIPKNSIKIPVAGGSTYSPDFAYVIEMANGTEKLHLIIEAKDVRDADGLRNEERLKIMHAEKFFGNDVKIIFETQFKEDKIVDIIKKNQ